MSLFNNKKGIDFMALMIPVLIIVLSFLSYHLIMKVEKYDLSMGGYAVELLDVYDQSIKDLLYIDLAADYSSRKAVFRWAQNKGFYEESCGAIAGYKLWNNETNPSQLCIQNVYKVYSKYLTKELNNYFSKKRWEVDYEFFATKEFVYGIAMNELKYPVFFDTRVTGKFWGITVFDEKVGSPKFGEYKIRPSFKAKFTNNLDELERLRKKIEKIVFLCSERLETRELVNNCIDQFELNSQTVHVEKSSKEDINIFKVTADMDSLNEDKTIEFEFALRIPLKKS